MKNSHFIFFVIIFIITLLLIALIIYLNQADRPTSLNQVVEPPTASDLLNRYQNSLIKDLEDFLSAKSFLSSDQPTKNEGLKSLEDQLLALLVPAEYKDLHLKLIIALNKLKTADPAEANQSRLIIEEQINLYQWLKPTLTLFLINLYQ